MAYFINGQMYNMGGLMDRFHVADFKTLPKMTKEDRKYVSVNSNPARVLARDEKGQPSSILQKETLQENKIIKRKYIITRILKVSKSYIFKYYSEVLTMRDNAPTELLLVKNNKSVSVNFDNRGNLHFIWLGSGDAIYVDPVGKLIACPGSSRNPLKFFSYLALEKKAFDLLTKGL
ncbi:MAG: hypothetical protein LBQ49_01715 [Rickettsiales bacterium]|jgi:hypothetical protein|nr:hypothetical protein [Rickettsiales bacterium]